MSDLKEQMGNNFSPKELFKHAITTWDEIADGVIRFSTRVDPTYIPGGFTYNQFLVLDDEPLLYHTGKKTMFPSFAAAFEKVLPFEKLRWIAFGHGEPDECGALNDILERAPACNAVVNKICNMVVVSDSIIRPPRIVTDGEVVVTGKHRLRSYDTPHFPHNWEASVMMDETSGTFFCGDLFTHLGEDLPVMVEGDLLAISEPVRHKLGYVSNPKEARPHLERIAAAKPETMAVMHGSSWRGDGADLLLRYADALEGRA